MEQHLSIFAEVSHDFQEAELVGVEGRGETEVDLLFRLGDERYRMGVRVDAEPPHGVIGLGIQPDVAESLRFGSIEELDRIMTEQEQAGAFSGVVLAAHGSEIRFHQAYGLADRDAQRPVTLDSRFDIGSLGKLFTSVAILRLAQEGRLDLDAPVSRYIDDLGEEIGGRITTRQLLQHRAGLGDYLGHPEFRAHPKRFRTLGDFMELVRGEPLHFEPGEGQRYSNSGFLVLGRVIEGVTGRDYYEVVREMVLTPAGMTATGPLGDAATATRYTRQDGEWASADHMWPELGTPAGGSRSTARDLHRFLVALLDDRLLDPRYTDTLLREFSGPTDQPLDRSGIVVGWGGGAPGLNASIGFHGESGRIVAVAANLDPPAASRIGRAVLESGI